MLRKFKVGDKVKTLMGAIGVITEIDWNSSTPFKITTNNSRLECDDTWIDLVEAANEMKAPQQTATNMGIRLNSGKPRWRNFPLFLIEDVIKVGSHAELRDGNPNGKYETFNFLKGMYVNDCMDSLKRHLMKFESPYESDNDEETQESHLAHIAWNALVALHMLKTRPELDDRFKLPEPKPITVTEDTDTFTADRDGLYQTAASLQNRGR